MKKIELVCMQKAKGYIQKADACILLQVYAKLGNLREAGLESVVSLVILFSSS